eukprot:9485085-Pyramimonas_sp.AAC.1
MLARRKARKQRNEEREEGPAPLPSKYDEEEEEEEEEEDGAKIRRQTFVFSATLTIPPSLKKRLQVTLRNYQLCKHKHMWVLIGFVDASYQTKLETARLFASWYRTTEELWAAQRQDGQDHDGEADGADRLQQQTQSGGPHQQAEYIYARSPQPASCWPTTRREVPPSLRWPILPADDPPAAVGLTASA